MHATAAKVDTVAAEAVQSSPMTSSPMSELVVYLAQRPMLLMLFRMVGFDETASAHGVDL
eukprot:6204016-Pleurochrysis_carterae.AAC.3